MSNILDETILLSAGVKALTMAEAVRPKLKAAEQALFVAGFQECAKYLANKTVNIRHGVFETNSSSTHSISIDDKEFLLDTLVVNSSGNVEIEVGEFGWEQDTYRDASTKASYLHMYCRDWVHPEDLKERFYQNLKEGIL